MPKRIFIRSRDGAQVPEAEAYRAGVLQDGYRHTDIIQPGEHVSMSLMMMDSAPRTNLRDAAGQPVTLYDTTTGHRMKLTADHITAIEAEAAKAGMGTDAYVANVLRYSLSPNA